jgi:hypothetical protein
MTTAPITINRDSFIATGPGKIDGDIEGTVELTMFGQTRRVKSIFVEKYGWVYAYGIEGMYRTGKKWWGGSVRSDADGATHVNFGRYDNHHKFSKTNVRFKDVRA